MSFYLAIVEIDLNILEGKTAVKNLNIRVHDGWVERIFVMYESFKIIFSLFPYHVDVINKPPPDVRLEKGVFNCRLL